MELIRYINDEIITEFADQKCVYLYHDMNNIYMFNEKIGMYMKYGSPAGYTYHDCLYSSVRHSKLYISHDWPVTCKDGFNLFRLGVTGRRASLLQCTSDDFEEFDGFEDFSHLTLVVTDMCCYLWARCRLESDVSYTREWNYLHLSSIHLNGELMTPHIIHRVDGCYAIISNKWLPISRTGVYAECTHTWYQNNYLYILDKQTRVFGICHQNNICHLIQHLRHHTCFLMWCLKQQTSFDNRSFKYYLPTCLFIDYILTSVLIMIKY